MWLPWRRVPKRGFPEARNVRRVRRLVGRMSEEQAFEVRCALEDTFGWSIPLVYTRDDAAQEWIAKTQDIENPPPFDDEAWDDVRFHKWWRDMATETMAESAWYTIDECVTEALRRRGVQIP